MEEERREEIAESQRILIDYQSILDFNQNGIEECECRKVMNLIE